ncbi:helix-turn-helix domain-containing protein [Yoonia sp.]|uniref:MerR family transcriptional regulator n=1 Tax=Yoonia sp. TaxID=2212373 RepID=UPI0019F95CAE|nr:helix-turn-helix domain-containing protein [Yoonia sp.]MBE0413806.1 helix-turn-helix domain-containing protein [Yoonia sp.]
MSGHKGACGLTRGDLARVTASNIETIRYYEKTGLLPDPPRSSAGYRIYSATHVARLRFILRARELGFAMADIRGLLGLEDGTMPNCAEVKATTERHLANVRAKIADLEKIAAVLAETAAKCSGALVPDCPVLWTLADDQGFGHGADPRP